VKETARIATATLMQRIAAMIDREVKVALGQRMMLFSMKKEICDPYFFLYQMNDTAILNQAKASVLGSAAPHVNIGSIKKFKFILPPFENQLRFSECVKEINKQKARLTASLEKLEPLYKSLTQRAFSGELFAE
jgi:type I restriction enzyme S subunit